MPTQLHDITITLESVTLPGIIGLPDGASGLVIFAHGSGSSRFSSRNSYVAGALHEKGIATLLFDLLTPEEDIDYARRFDIDLLTDRLVQTTHWALRQPQLLHLKIGYFGASTGSASALKASARIGPVIRAVVSRGGRPDLAMEALTLVESPTLLIVGGEDDVVIGLNQQAYDRLTAVRELAIIPGATHLFEEPGALDEVARLAGEWFQRYLGAAGEERRAA